MLTGQALAGLGHSEAAAVAYRQSCELFHAIDRPDAAVEPLAGLARLALGRGDFAKALAQVEPILVRLESGDVEPPEEILRVDLTCYEVLETAYSTLRRALGALPGQIQSEHQRAEYRSEQRVGHPRL